MTNLWIGTRSDCSWCKANRDGRSGAQVLALAICTRHPFIQIFKVCPLRM
jgi:hypothetical protein